MTPGTKVASDGAVAREERLRVLGRLELLQMAFSLSHVSVRIFRAHVRRLVRNMLDLGKDVAERSSIAAKLVSDNDCRLVPETSQQPLEELLRRFLVTSVRDEDVKFDTILINRTPQVLLLTFYLKEDLIEVPDASGLWSFLLDLGGKVRSEIEAPFPDSFMADHDAPLQEKVTNISQAQAKAVIKPDGVSNDFDGESVARIKAVAHRGSSG